MTFSEKLLALYGRFEYMRKEGTNDHFEYSFLQESAIKARFNLALRELGLVVTRQYVQPVGEVTGKHAVVQLTLDLADAACMTDHITLEGIGGGIDSSDKAPMKAVVSAWKYAIMNGLSIPTGDDPEGSPSERVALDDLVARIGVAATVADLKPLSVEAKALAVSKRDKAKLRDAFKRRSAELTGPTESEGVKDGE